MQSFFSNRFALQDAASEISLVLSHMIVKRNKLFSDSEFIKDCLSHAADIICPEQKQKFESILLSRKTVVKRINQLSENLMKQLRDVSKEFLCYFLALDESTDLQDTAQLLIFIRGINSRFEITEELLGVESLKDTTTIRDLFGAVENCV
ncbi:General transcription factor II-I repeat domain-containing protein 2A [Cucumispora dikerogammari]|nr:General transcription factor II-I repeat domain-containing protein 2A [Cucumispora dikerogammari]